MKAKKNTTFGGLQRKQNGGMALRRTRLNSNRAPADLVEVGSFAKRLINNSQSGRDDQLNVISKHAGNVVHGEENGRIKHYKRCHSWEVMNAHVEFEHGCSHGPRQSPADFQESFVEPFANKVTKKKCLNIPPSVHIGNTQEACRKVTSMYKMGRSKDVVLGEHSHFFKKVDAVAYPNRLMGEKYMHSSFKDEKTGSLINVGHKKSIVYTRCLISRGIDHSETRDCSVASCSSTSYPSYNLPDQHATRPDEDMDNYFDDAESSCAFGHGKKCCYATKAEMAAEIHKLELRAYRSTMEALHASGLLSWEQEALMTTLRLNLHISNDEHLLELRQLVSPQKF